MLFTIYKAMISSFLFSSVFFLNKNSHAQTSEPNELNKTIIKDMQAHLMSKNLEKQKEEIMKQCSYTKSSCDFEKILSTAINVIFHDVKHPETPINLIKEELVDSNLLLTTLQSYLKEESSQWMLLDKSFSQGHPPEGGEKK